MISAATWLTRQRVTTNRYPVVASFRGKTLAAPAEAIRVTSEQADASTLTDGERKTVTALFADIKGSMELIEDLDPEEARYLVDPALKLMMDAVHRYGGYVAQSTGDEDHSQRALYAALKMQEEMRRYATNLREADNLPTSNAHSPTLLPFTRHDTSFFLHTRRDVILQWLSVFT